MISLSIHLVATVSCGNVRSWAGRNSSLRPSRLDSGRSGITRSVSLGKGNGQPAGDDRRIASRPVIGPYGTWVSMPPAEGMPAAAPGSLPSSSGHGPRSWAGALSLPGADQARRHKRAWLAQPGRRKSGPCRLQSRAGHHRRPGPPPSLRASFGSTRCASYRGGTVNRTRCHEQRSTLRAAACASAPIADSAPVTSQLIYCLRAAICASSGRPEAPLSQHL